MKFLSWFNYFRHHNSLFLYQCSKEEYVSVPRGMSVSIIYMINHNDLARTHPQKLRSQNLTSPFFYSHHNFSSAYSSDKWDHKWPIAFSCECIIPSKLT